MSELKKRFGLFTAICMVVGIVIGSGVFFKAQDILVVTEGNMIQGILAWFIGGVVMLFCVLAFSVMAQKYEKVNGVVDYAEMTVGSKYGYYVGWFLTFLYYPTMTSVLSWLCARYTLTFLCAANPDFALHISASEGGTVFGPECMTLACLFLVLSFSINALSPKLAGKIQVSTTVIKLIPLALMAVIGTIYGLTHPAESVEATILVHNFSHEVQSWDLLFPAVVATAFAYEGWIVATSINAELKNAKRNLPIALIVGALIIIAVYIFYFVGVAGGASVETLRADGATKAFINVFGPIFGNILNLFVAISCMGTLNGLMLGCSRGIYSISVRGYGPKPRIFSQVDKETNMPVNSCIVAALLSAGWLFYFYCSQLVPESWFGIFTFDSSELPIVTTYAIYIPIFISFMIKEKNIHPVKRFLLPALAIIGAGFMVFAAVYAHGIKPYMAAAEKGEFSCPVIFYLIIFAVIMFLGIFFTDKKKNRKS